jgi:hypothetical protein
MPAPLLNLLAQGSLGVPPLDPKEVMKAGPVGHGLQRPRPVRDLPPPPDKSHGQHQPPKGQEMVPVNGRTERPKELVKGGRHASDAEHGAIFLLLLAGGK